MTVQRKQLSVTVVVPTYPSRRCGISTYSAFLLEALQPHVETKVVAASGGGALDLLARVRAAASCSDIVHIQHAFDIYGYLGIQTFPLALLLRHARARVVTTIHELPPPLTSSLKDRLVAPYLRACIRTLAASSDATVVHTEASLALLSAWKVRGRVQLIPHGAAGTLAASAASARRSGGRTIGFFGFINQAKGIHRLIDALPSIPGAHLVVAGAPRTTHDEHYATSLREQVAKLGLGNRVTFKEYVPDEELGAFFASIDLLVFPYSHFTASGALHIALAHGSAVLTSDLPVFEELRRQQNCLETFALDEPASLATRIRLLLDDEPRRALLRARATCAAREVSWENVARAHVQLYGTVLNAETAGVSRAASALNSGGGQ